ncbi:LysE family transporter [Chryseoglobus sp. 28M-23]|uniref:LysE family transporter n=1 Tax=Chryseoglobus sp. 28M-23 TaxID=2772253 RepID=UPI0017464A5E|nr:LysE family transporter [Chryseoglobus sp. 28M-23]QOD93612.1 LysE family transporter [Chryseoglobus sp. 28M-23]
MSDALFSSLTAGLLAGYAIAIPVGAIAALLITHGARHGARVAAGGALGAATVDGLYATIAVVAGAAIAPVIVLIEEPLRWLSVIVLVALGIMIALPGLRAAPRHVPPISADAPTDAAPADAALADAALSDTTPAPAPSGSTATASRTTTARRLFLTVGALTLVNPVTVVYFAALIGSSTLALDASPLERIVFVAAAFAASLSWQLLLTTAGALAGRALVGPIGARITALVGGGIIILLAVRAAWGG